MELTVDREDRIYTNMPDSLSRRFKPHKNQLTPGVGLIRQIGQGNPGGVQAKGNDGVISQNQRNSFYNFPRGRNKAYCVQLWIFCPHFQAEAGVSRSYPNFHIIEILIFGNSSKIVVVIASFISCACRQKEPLGSN